MTKTLILMRHAKSSWDNPFLSDHDRPLNGRGIRSAQVLGVWLRERGYLPGEALVSSSRRTVETFEGLALDVPLTVTKALYHAGADAMLGQLRAATADTVLMLGHNPGIGDFAERLVTTPPAHDRFEDYPTGATLIASFDVDRWPRAQWGRATAVDFAVPRELGA